MIGKPGHGRMKKQGEVLKQEEQGKHTEQPNQFQRHGNTAQE